MSYYNTTKQKRSVVEIYESKTANQEQIIAEVMRRCKAMTPFKMWASLNRNGLTWPITSVRRAMTDLKNKGVLEKGGLKPGIYGKPEHEYLYVKKLG